MHGVLQIWRHMLRTHMFFDQATAMPEEALDANIQQYVDEWFKNISIGLQCVSTTGLDDSSHALRLEEEEFEQVLCHLDFAVWALLRMHRQLPFVQQLAKLHLPRELRLR